MRSQTALRRGPIVYCLESVDLPKSANILDVFVGKHAKIEALFKPALLGGVTSLQLQASYVHDPEWSVAPYSAPHLYKELTAQAEKWFKAQFIPYFAWSNRGPSQMTVWLPYAR